MDLLSLGSSAGRYGTYPMDPSVEGVGDAPLSCTNEGVSESCRIVVLLRSLVACSVLACSAEMVRGSSDPMMSRLSSPSGIDSRRSFASSYSSESVPGLPLAVAAVFDDEPA